MGTINKVTVLGRLGKDPEIKTTNAGKSVATFSVATSEKYTDAAGNKKETTEWHNLVLWGQLADVAAKYLHKGDQAHFEGKLQTRKWQDKAGVDHYTTEIVVKEIVLLGAGKQAQGEPAGDNASGGMPPAPEDSLPF